MVNGQAAWDTLHAADSELPAEKGEENVALSTDRGREVLCEITLQEVLFNQWRIMELAQIHLITTGETPEQVLRVGWVTLAADS